MDELSLTFTVQYYPADSVKVQIPLDNLRYGILKHSCLKQAVGKALNLKEKSLDIFGIYSGQLGDPKELCPERYCVLNYTLDYCFQRLAPNDKEELEVIHEDERALELVFWEVKSHYETRTIFPRPKKDIRRNMEYQRQFTKLVMSSKVLMAKLTEEYHRNRSAHTFTNHSVFVEVVRKIPQHYMLYYYVVESCTLKYALPTNPPIKRGEIINVVMKHDKCIALDVTGQHELASWDWKEVNIVDPRKRVLPSYQSLYGAGLDDDAPRSGLHFTSKSYMLVYSMSKHFQLRYSRQELE